MDMNLSKSWETVKDREAWPATIHGVTVRHDLVTEKQQIVDLQYYMFQLYNIVIHTFKDYISFTVIIKYWLYSLLESYFHMLITQLPI